MTIDLQQKFLIGGITAVPEWNKLPDVLNLWNYPR